MLPNNRNHVEAHTQVTKQLDRFLTVIDDVTEYVHNVLIVKTNLAKQSLEFIQTTV